MQSGSHSAADDGEKDVVLAHDGSACLKQTPDGVGSADMDRQNEVGSAFAHEDMDTHNERTLVSAAASGAAQHADALIGSVLDNRYCMLEQIGSGGMSTVYKARHVTMDVVRAIKVLYPRLASEKQSTLRFLQEAKAVASLQHPNVVAVYDSGVTGDGRPYIAMDCLIGESLADVIQAEHFLERQRAIDIFVQITNGLAAAHQRGIIHRDLKPGNIMLVKGADGQEVVKILDFGIAKVLSEDEVKDVQLTQTGEIFGSPLYMSPEQCTGSKVDARSDVYALGCVMYEALTGRPPFSGGTIYETIHKQVWQIPERFSSVRPELAGVDRLESVVLRCLEKSPEKRYQSMLELKSELLAIRHCSRTSLKDALRTLVDLFVFESKRACRRSGALALAVSLAGALALAVWYAAPLADIAIDRPESLWKIDLLSDLPCASTSVAAQERIASGNRYLVLLEIQQGPQLEKEKLFADNCYGKGVFEPAEYWYEQICRLASNGQYELTIPEKVHCLLRAGDLHFRRQDIEGAHSYYRRALPLIPGMREMQPINYGPVYTRMAYCSALKSDSYETLRNARSLALEADKEARIYGGLRSLAAATVLADIDKQMGELGRGPEAKAILREAQDRYRMLALSWASGLYRNPRNEALALYQLAEVCTILGDLKEAESSFAKAEPLISSEFGPNSSLAKSSLKRRAEALWQGGNYAAALLERLRAKLKEIF
ncbi:MAG TPA: serine/threonine-protein kinase [Candidatus Obscuribacterales bacterium]